jgi:hypothetical protein
VVYLSGLFFSEFCWRIFIVRKILSPGDCIEGRILCLRGLLFVDACTGSSTALYHLQLFDDRCYQKYGFGNPLDGSCVYIPGYYLLAEVIY